MCVHAWETGQWWQGNQQLPLRIAWQRDWDDTNNPSSRGGMQIEWSTWQSVGGHGDPAAASRAEQVYRAYLIWRQDGNWSQWTTAALCGLT